MNHAAAPAPQSPAPAPDASPVVALRGVSVAFDGPPVLQDITFSVAPAETRILLGPAGVGKSVLLKLIIGLLRPQQGSIVLFGEDISRMPEQKLFPLRSRAGMVFQESALFDSLTVRDNVAYQLIQERVPDEEIDSRVREALSFVGLEETFHLYPPSLSGGMRRRVAIARAFIHEPELILYDSPTGGLDPVTSTTIIELIVKQRDVRANPLPARHPSPAGRLHPLQSPLRRRKRLHGPAPRRPHQPQYHLPHARRGPSHLRWLSPRTSPESEQLRPRVSGVKRGGSSGQEPGWNPHSQPRVSLYGDQSI